MPKSKEFIDSSDSASDSESKPKSAAAAKPSKSKTSDSKESAAKRTKTDDSSSGATASKAGPSGERLYEIGRLRYVSVSEFRGKPYINIREYYEDHGVEKPGKKGISLAVDQWDKLKSLMEQVDKDLKKFK